MAKKTATEAGKRARAGAAPKPRKTKEKHSATAPPEDTAVRVRMYRQGLGDCFLLAFPRPNGTDFFVLIDCGVILGTLKPEPLMQAVMKDIVATTNNKVDVLIVTHEHWDHVSGFEQASDLFCKLEIGQVWMAWTEDPLNQLAQRLRQNRHQKLAALWLGLHQMRANLKVSMGADAADDALKRAAEVLTFFGINRDEPPPVGEFAAAVAAAGGKTGAAMSRARNKSKDIHFWKPGDTIDPPNAPPGTRVYVLGPPLDQTQLFKDLPTRGGRETYDDKGVALVHAMFGWSFDGAQRPESATSTAFDKKYRVFIQEARDHTFFMEHYFGSADPEAETWRRIDTTGIDGATDFALQLDSDTNNTSLALAFELQDGRVLLFPGDAQVGNWESWHADSDGKPRVWSRGPTQKISAEQLLNRTVLYKVGHHGSHNATLREKGLEMMTDSALAAMLPVDVYIARDKKRWGKMPFDPLMHRLREATKGRILQVDQPLKSAAPGNGRTTVADALPAPFRARVRDATTNITVEVAEGKTEARPLYVEYYLPALKKAGSTGKPHKK